MEKRNVRVIIDTGLLVPIIGASLFNFIFPGIPLGQPKHPISAANKCQMTTRGVLHRNLKIGDRLYSVSLRRNGFKAITRNGFLSET